MSRSAISLFVFGIFMILIGVPTILFPQYLTLSSGPPTPDYLYIRFTGFFAAALGSYCILAARHEWKEFFRWSIYTRSTLVLMYIVLVLSGNAESRILIDGVIDLAGAIWTAWALRSENVRLLVTQPPN